MLTSADDLLALLRPEPLKGRTDPADLEMLHPTRERPPHLDRQLSPPRRHKASTWISASPGPARAPFWAEGSGRWS
jgi:hypothetical protein